MKTIRLLSYASLVFMISIGFTSCLNDRYSDIESNTIQPGFEFKTIQEYTVTVKTFTSSDSILSGSHMVFYTANPLDNTGVILSTASDNVISQGITDENGELVCKISPATTVDSLYILADQIGLPRLTIVALNNADLNVTLGGSASGAVKVQQQKTAQKTVPATQKTADGKYYILGSWNTLGVPNYLWPGNDVLNANFLHDVNASLPEGVGLPYSHPEYLENTDDGNLVLIKDAEISLTFVHEGAGYLNSILYYTYPTGSAPSLASNISNATVIFPNVSYTGSGGGLVSGNKVQLYYLDPVTKVYSTVFPAGTTVAWIFKANAWNGSTVGNGAATYYSDPKFNPESQDSKKKHNVILKDGNRHLFLMGFEDLNRQNGSDEDFNDGVFYATVTPYSAVKEEIYQSVNTALDTDGDGVPDASDEYPNDATRAYNNYYPSSTGFATLAFEDLWPYKGDYDFNDLVVDYRYNQITNAQNKVVELDAVYKVKAIGASYVNGFGLQLNTTPDNVKSVTGEILTEGLVDNNSNGTEKSQSKAVIIAFDNAYEQLKHVSGVGVNTVIGDEYAEPQAQNLKIVFNTAISQTDLGSAPYNPFIFINRVRSKEVHLPGLEPTDLADTSLFGTGDDDSDKSTSNYYMSDGSLPWALNFPVVFDYPVEKADIRGAYLMFNTWAKSNGSKNKDWYGSVSGYRNANLIYHK